LYGFSTGNPSINLDNKISGSAKSDLINRINVGLAANQDIAAYQILYRDVQSTIQTYQLQNDDDVSRATQQILSRICSLAQARLDATATEAENYGKINNYIAARDAQSRALAINAEFGICHLDLTRLNAQRDRINACAEYQDKLHLAQDAERVGNYDRAIELFIEAARAYDAPLVAGNLPKDASYNLYDYIHASTVGAFNFSGALYYSDESHKDIDKSYALLKLALAHRQNPKSTGFLQNRLGAAFAEKLYQPGTKSKDAIAQVVPAELKKALKTFSKAMCKRWKQLK
jgi:tetratricopeptide (TPR) repeat protein